MESAEVLAHIEDASQRCVRCQARAEVSDASEVLPWIAACVRQIDRFAVQYDQAFNSYTQDDDPKVDYEAWERARPEAYFLIMGTDQLRNQLGLGVHRDLLDRFPWPWYLDPEDDNPDLPTDGATHLRYVRNAFEHGDTDHRFSSAYGFGHGGWVGSHGRDVNIGGYLVSDYDDLFHELRNELEARRQRAKSILE